MASRRYKNRFYRFLHKLGQSPIEVLEFFQYLALFWVLSKALIGFGGFLSYGSPMIEVSSGLLILTALHALVVAFRKERKGLDWELLLPLPFIAYAWWHFQFISPAPWEASLLLTTFVQSYVLYYLCYNTIHGGKAGLWILAVCQLVVVMAMLTAFFQFYQFPEWMVTLDRERSPAYQGGAAGLLLDPHNLGALMILAWPASVLIVWLKRFSGPIRMLNGFYILAMLVGLILSTHRPGLAVFLGTLVILPFFLTRRMAVRWRLWRYGLLGLVLSVPILWFGTDALRLRLLQFFDQQGDALADASLSAAWTLFGQHPIFGGGLGSFAFFWESIRPADVQGSSLYPASSYADILGELGVVGLLCLAIPLLVLIYRGFRMWLVVPYLTVNKDVRERMDRFPVGHPGRGKLEAAHGRAPSSKIALGSLILGLISFCVYIGWDFAIKLPLHLFLVACLCGVLAALSRRSKRLTVSPYVGLLTGLVPFILAAWAFSFGVPRFYSQNLLYTTNEQLDYLLDDPDRIFLDPGVLSSVLGTYEGVVELDPQRAGGWIGIGRTWLARLHADLWPSEDLARGALPALERALELAPQSWLAHYEMARTLAILGEDKSQVDEHLRRALELAPHRIEPPAFLGSLLLLRDPQSEEGVSLLQQARSIDPDFEPVQNAFRRLDLNSRGSIASGQRGSVFSEALLAEQFEVVNYSRERVLAAGVMPTPEEVIPIPES